MQIMAYGDLTYFGASRAAKCLFPEIGAPIQNCVFRICGLTLTTSSHRYPSRTAQKCVKDGCEWRKYTEWVLKKKEGKLEEGGRGLISGVTDTF